MTLLFTMGINQVKKKGEEEKGGLKAELVELYGTLSGSSSSSSSCVGVHHFMAP
jgi:hypothetical protein